MGRTLRIEVLQPSELGPTERELWASFRAAQPHLASPYFDLRYALAAGEVCPDGHVAILHRGGRIDGFLPFQRRGKRIQPLGAPLTDYHGVIGRPGVEFDLADVVRQLGGDRFRFSGLKAPVAPRGAAAHRAMVADLTGGYDAYLANRRLAGHADFLKDKRRRLKLITRDHAPITLSFGADEPGALGFVLKLKREQLARAGQHDIFDCGWTERLLRTLLEHEDADFGARIAVLRTGGAIAAAEIGLLSGKAYHLWFPVYDHAYHRYSPGQLMTLETLRCLADRGVTHVDFGPAGETYKRAFADPCETVYEGDVAVSPWRGATAMAPPFQAERLRFGRRVDRIIACEPRFGGRARAASKYLGVIARRHKGVTAAAGAAGLAVGISLLSL